LRNCTDDEKKQQLHLPICIGRLRFFDSPALPYPLAKLIGAPVMKRVMVVAFVVFIAMSVAGCSWPRCLSRGACCGTSFEGQMIGTEVINGTITYDGEAIDAGPVGRP
jgi:hypothetical protein